MIDLDEKDKKILFFLDFNARISNNLLAKKVGLSKQGVDYRIERLIKRGVINGFYPVIDIGKLGFIYGRLFLKFHNMTMEKEREVLDEIISDKRIKWILICEGSYDLILATWTRSLHEFKEISESFMERYGIYIKEKKESLGISVSHFQSRYLQDYTAANKYSIAYNIKTTKNKDDNKDNNKDNTKNGNGSENNNEDNTKNKGENNNEYYNKNKDNIKKVITEPKEVIVGERLPSYEISKFNLDDIDRDILRRLCNNARDSLVNIANSMGISAKVVAYRIKRMEKKGIILAYRPNINHNIIGLTHYKILFNLMNIEKSIFRKFKEYLRMKKETIYIVEEIGICDVDVELMIKSNQDFFNFMKRIKYDFPSLIRDYETLIIVKTAKIDYLPF